MVVIAPSPTKVPSASNRRSQSSPPSRELTVAKPPSGLAATAWARLDGSIRKGRPRG
jgi:hypothetical protein